MNTDDDGINELRARQAEDPRQPMVWPADLAETTELAWTALVERSSDTDPRRFLCRFGGAIAWLQENEFSGLETMPLEQRRMIRLLARACRWMRPKADGSFSPISPPGEVANDLLVDPEAPLPRLERLVTIPVIAPDGAVHDDVGYDQASRCFYRPEAGLSIPRVPDHPTANDVERAVALLHELVRDFPFKGNAEHDDGASERAHAFAALLLPFVRRLIDGPTPLHLLDAPAPGTGKSLLAKTLAVPSLGARELPAMAPCRDEDEWRKRLTSKLRRAPEFLMIDNVRAVLDSSALASLVTAQIVEDRLLGVSEIVTLPVRCTLFVTGNNLRLSDEMTRRAVRIRLDTGLENPEHGRTFDHELPRWAVENRGELIWAALTLARSWWVAGKPGPAAPLGGFEAWSEVVGGILEHAGIAGFLANTDELRDAGADTALADFLRAVYAAHGERAFMAREIVTTAQEFFDLGSAHADALAQKVGSQLRELRDRPLDGLVLRARPRGDSGGRSWAVRRLGS